MLRCPVCGKEYGYENKICLECEAQSLHSLSLIKPNIKGILWNCGIFLESTNVIFGRRKIDEYGWKDPVESYEFNTTKRRNYNWNCMSTKDALIELCMTDDIENLKEIKFLKGEKKLISLIYE